MRGAVHIPAPGVAQGPKPAYNIPSPCAHAKTVMEIRRRVVMEIRRAVDKRRSSFAYAALAHVQVPREGRVR